MSYSGILGMNARNLLFVRPYNKKAGVKLVDSKLDTKKLLQQKGIPTPKMYGSIGSLREFEEFNFNKLPQSFVIKPNRGFGGGGIVVLRGSDKKEVFLKKPVEQRVWVTPGGEEYSFADLKSHILDILYGKFSLSNAPDSLLIEKKIVVDKRLLKLCGAGVPDIRVIVFNKVPVMAMLRLPTQKSKGRANLMMGGIGLGIDIGTGETTTAFVKVPQGHLIEFHPDTDEELLGFYIPHWDDVLKISVEAQEVSGLGYIGSDVVLDRRDGPQILELNARPGLGIQSANLDGLQKRLNRVRGLKVKSTARGVRIGQELFGGEVERRVEDVTGREVIGLVEEVVLMSKSGRKKVSTKAKIDTGARMTSIDMKLASKLGFKSVVDYMKETGAGKKGVEKKELEKQAKEIKKDFTKKGVPIEEVRLVKSSSGYTLRPVVQLSYYISGQKVETMVNIADRSGMLYEMLVGKMDMEHFVIDPTMRNDWEKEAKRGK